MPGSTASPQNTPKFDLLIDGSAAPAALLESLITIRVHQDLEMADCLELRLSNPDLAWTESDAVAEGKEIRVELGYEETSIGLAFQGHVVRRDCQFPERGPAIVTVVAYDTEHALKHGRHTKAWLDTKDSEIASEIASDLGLQAEVKATSLAHRYLVQYDQTHLSFLRERAARIGYEVRLDRENKSLYFGPPTTSGEVKTLTWEIDLYAFSPRMSTVGQVSKVAIRGWDMTTKEPIQSQSETSATTLKLDASDVGAALAAKVYSAREVLYANTPLFEAGEADALAAAKMEALAARYSQATGVCLGDTALVPGSLIDIQAVGERAAGRYYVDRVLQHFQPGLGYSCHFEAHRAAERLQPAEPEPLPKVVPSREEAPRDAEQFVEFVVSADAGESVEGWDYTVTLPGGDTRQGKLDAEGKIRVEGVRDPGEVKIEIQSPEDMTGPAKPE